MANRITLILLNLSQKINEYIEAGYARFHSPAHAGGLNLRDLSEVEGLDNLQEPQEILEETQVRIAKLFSAKKSLMLVGGASIGMQAAILALKKYLSKNSPNKPVLVARNIHQSTLAGLILADIEIDWLELEWHQELGVFTRFNLDYDSINKNYAAIILTNPSYEGFYSEVDSQRLKIPLIVDEAHGAHYQFSNQLPEPALSYGADLVVQSWHKTLGSLTQTGVLHLNQNSKINPELVQESLKLIQTTSPSYLLLESISKVTEEFTKSGQTIIEDSITKAGHVNKNIFNNDDPLRFLFTAGNLSGGELYDYFSARKISCEEILANAVLFFINPGNSNEDIDKLSQAINSLDLNQKEKNKIIKPVFYKQELKLREAFFAKSIEMPTEEAFNHIAAEIYAPCPPGIPLIIPGQRLSQENLEILKQNKKARIKVIASK